MKPTVEIRGATRDDVAFFFGDLPKKKFLRALVIVIDGHPEAIGGTYYENGYSLAFMDLRPAVRAHRKHLVKAMKTAMETIVKNSKFPVIAIADENEPTAPGLLRHFGFKQMEGDEETYEWRR